MLELEKCGLVEMSSVEVKEVEGGQWEFASWAAGVAHRLRLLSGGGSASTSCYTDGSYLYF